MKRGMRRSCRALAMEYAVLLIFIVTILGGLILTLAQLTVRNADSYGDYVRSKLFLDSVGDAAIEKYVGGAEIDLGQYTSEAETFGYTLNVSEEATGETVVTVTKAENVLLYIRFQTEAGACQLVKFCYHAGYTNGTPEAGE